MTATPAPGHEAGIVIGIGNPFRRDDGVGVAVASRLAHAAVPFGGAAVAMMSGEPTALLDAWAGRPFAVVIDAIAEGDGPPGAIEIVRVGGGPLPWAGRAGGTHDVDLTQAIALGEALDLLPRVLVVVGVHGADFEQGEGLSPAVEGMVAGVAAVVEAMAEELERAQVEGG